MKKQGGVKAAIYCRLSKEDEGRTEESESIQNQRAMLTQYALEQGYEIYKVYCDEDYSGVDRERPAFNALLAAAARQEFQVVLVKTQSRFTRDMELVEKYLHGSFAEWGIRFIALVDHADTGDAANKKSRQINGLVNEWYLEDLSGNVRSVLDYKRRQGQYIAAFALYGYQKDPKDKNRLLIDPEAALVVERIFELYLAGCGAARIAALLNEQGVPNPTQYKQQRGSSYKNGGGRASGLWSKATVYQMLRNRTYMGDLVQGRHKKVSYKSKKTVRLAPQDWIVAPGTHAPIIAPETFQLVQTMLAGRARSSGKGAIHPLAGKVRCAVCGAAMELTASGTLRKDGSRARYLRCRGRQKKPQSCAAAGYIPLEPVEAAVLERLRVHTAALFRPQAVEWEAWTDREAQRENAGQTELKRLRRQAGLRRKALEELYLDKSAGLIGTEQFQALNAAYLRQVKEYEARALRFEKELEQPQERQAGGEQLRRRAQELLRLETLPRQLVSLLVSEVLAGPPDPATGQIPLEIHWLF